MWYSNTVFILQQSSQMSNETSWYDVTSCYNFLSFHIDSALTYVFLNYATDLRWLTWLLYPIVVTFVLPFVIVIFLYASAFVLQLYALRRHFFEAYRMERPWDGARRVLAACWDAQGKIWHGNHWLLMLSKFTILYLIFCHY